MNEPSSAVLKVDKIPVTDSTVGGYVALATINRPNKLNALNVDVMDSLKTLCAWVENSDDIRCLVITGAKPLPAEEGLSLIHI